MAAEEARRGHGGLVWSLGLPHRLHRTARAEGLNIVSGGGGRAQRGAGPFLLESCHGELDKSSKKAAAAKKGRKREANDEIENAVSAKKQKAELPSKEDANKAKVQSPPKKAKSRSGSSLGDSEDEKVQAKYRPAPVVVDSSADDDSCDDIFWPNKAPSDDDNFQRKKKESKQPTDKTCSDEETTCDSDDESDEEAPPKPKAPAAATKKENSSKSEDSDSENKDKSRTAKVAQPANRAASKMNNESSDASDNDSDEEPPQKKQKYTASSADAKAAAAKKETSDDDDDTSSDESSDDGPKKSQQKKAPKASASGGSDGESFGYQSDKDNEEDEETTKTPIKEASAGTSEKQTATKEPKMPTNTKSQATGSKTLYMGNIPFGAKFGDIKEFFEAPGKVIDIRFPTTNEDGSSKGFCFVEFVSTDAAKEAFEAMTGKKMQGRSVRLEYVHERNAYTPCSGNHAGSFQKPARDSSSCVFIRGFDRSLEEDKIRRSLEQHFTGCGEIARISIPTDYETGAIKGIAYIDFKDQDSLSKALELSGSTIGDYELYVDEAKRRGYGQHSGGRFGNRSGGRYGRKFGRGGGCDDDTFGRGGVRGGNCGGGRGFANRQSSSTASAGKKTTFGDDE